MPPEKRVYTSAGVCCDPQWHYQDGSLRWAAVPNGMKAEDWEVALRAHRDGHHGYPHTRRKSTGRGKRK